MFFTNKLSIKFSFLLFLITFIQRKYSGQNVQNLWTNKSIEKEEFDQIDDKENYKSDKIYNEIMDVEE